MTEEVQEKKKKISPIEAVKKHYAGKIAGALHCYHVEEWGIDVYYRTTTTLKQEAKIVELSTQGKTIEALIEAIITKSLDESGKPLFSPYDRAALLNEADPAVILNLSRVLNGSDLPTIEEAEKN